MNDLIKSTRKHDRSAAINSCDAVATRNSPPDIVVGNALCSEPTMPITEIAAAKCSACFLYLSMVATAPAKARVIPNPLGISAVALERPVRIQLNSPSMISAEASPIVIFAMVTSASAAPERWDHFNLATAAQGNVPVMIYLLRKFAASSEPSVAVPAL